MMDQPLSRRAWLRLAAGGAAGALAGGALAGTALAQQPAGAAKAAAKAAPAITVYKSPSCGCCAKWVDHLRGAGFAVKTNDTEDVDAIKRQVGVPDALASCHTGLVSGYVVEGHVPAGVIQRLLRERPSVAGIAVPGMPTGSPGMESPVGRKDAYDVVAFDRKGKTRVFASVR
jgi:hypothetical protein